MSDETAVGLSRETLEWLATRRRCGNWFEVAPADEIPHDIIGVDRTILHIFQIALTPEIQRRSAAGLLADDFTLIAAQLIQPLDGPNTIRLNSEVRGEAILRVSRPVENGGAVFIEDIRELQVFDLEEIELDAGHFTMLWTGTGWAVSFDFRSGRRTAAQLIQCAREFLAAAKASAANGHVRPSVDTLFSACELLSKAHLMLHRSPAAKAKTHGAVGSAINLWGQLGNVNAQFVRLFNRTAEMRVSAKYDVGTKIDAPTDADFDLVNQELVLLERIIAQGVRKVVDVE